MSDCQNIQKYLNQYLDGALEPAIKKTVTAHLDQCADCRNYFVSELALERKLKSVIQVQRPDEQIIWARAIESVLRAGQKKTWPVFQQSFIIKYLVPLASAAVIILAILPLLLFPGGAIPEIVRMAAQEHQSFLNNQVKFEVAAGSAEEITRYFQEKRNFGIGECCGAMLQKDDLELKGGRMLEVQNASIAAINAMYQNTPVTVVILPESCLPSFPKTQKCVKKCHEISDAKIQNFNYALMRVENQIICVISRMDAGTLKKLLQDTREMQSCGCGH